jgi:hypothetical protein
MSSRRPKEGFSSQRRRRTSRSIKGTCSYIALAQSKRHPHLGHRMRTWRTG